MSTVARADFASLEIGFELPARTVTVTRADLVRYAGASGDFNPIHWNERFAREVQLPGVIAHGMFTMGVAVQLVTDWMGDPAAVVSYSTRFTKPVVVPDTEAGNEIHVSGKIAAVDEQKNQARIDLTVIASDQKVLVKAQVVVAF